MTQTVSEKALIRQAREDGRPSEDDVAQDRLGWRGQTSRTVARLLRERPLSGGLTLGSFMWPISTRVNKPENDDASIPDRYSSKRTQRQQCTRSISTLATASGQSGIN